MNMQKTYFFIIPVVFICCQRPSQNVSYVQKEIINEDFIEQENTDSLTIIPEDEIQYLPMDSIWRYYNDSQTTSGRCNKPPFYLNDNTQNLYYGFYSIHSELSQRQLKIIANFIVSFNPSKRWVSRDTSQKICVLFVLDKLFQPKVASFNIGDNISQITEDYIKKIDNIYFYSKGHVIYGIDENQDTIRQFVVLYSCTDFEWDTLHKHVKKHFEQYEKYR